MRDLINSILITAVVNQYNWFACRSIKIIVFFSRDDVRNRLEHTNVQIVTHDVSHRSSTYSTGRYHVYTYTITLYTIPNAPIVVIVRNILRVGIPIPTQKSHGQSKNSFICTFLGKKYVFYDFWHILKTLHTNLSVWQCENKAWVYVYTQI